MMRTGGAKCEGSDSAGGEGLGSPYCMESQVQPGQQQQADYSVQELHPGQEPPH